MKRRYGVLALALPVALMVGCAFTSVRPWGKDTYIVHASGYGRSASEAALAKKAHSRANAFCAEQGKVMQPVSYEWEVGDYELRFRALGPDDPEVTGPAMETTPDVGVDVQER